MEEGGRDEMGLNTEMRGTSLPIIYFYAAFNLHFLFAADKSGQGTQGR